MRRKLITGTVPILLLAIGSAQQPAATGTSCEVAAVLFNDVRIETVVVPPEGGSPGYERGLVLGASFDRDYGAIRGLSVADGQ
jgi:hypothetical protein